MQKLLFLTLLLLRIMQPIESAGNLEYAANEAYKEAVEAFRKKNYALSSKLFKEAATRGHPEAYYFLGRMVEVGYGYKKNKKRAYYLYKKGLEKGSKRAHLRLKQIRSARSKKSKRKLSKRRLLPEWEMEEEGIFLSDAIDELEENPESLRLEYLPSLFNLTDERNIGKNLPQASLVKEQFLSAINLHGSNVDQNTWFELCDMKAFQISWLAKFNRASQVCSSKADSYWKAKRLIKNKNSVSDIYKEMQVALESDINDNQRVELFAEYANLIDRSAARHYLSKAFEKLISNRQGPKAIESMVRALGQHKSPNEGLEIMDLGHDFYAAAYFRSAMSFLKINQIARAQTIYKMSAGKLGYHSSIALAFEYNWELYKLNYHQQAMHQFKKIMIHSDNFVPHDWFVIANLLQNDHVFRKDSQIAFEKCLQWKPRERVYGDLLILARAYQQKSVEQWGIKGPLSRYKETEE